MCIQKRTDVRRLILWALVAVYTIALPDVIVAYRAIERQFSSHVAGKIPLIIIIILGLCYAIFSLSTQKNLKFLAYLLPSSVIVIVIVSLESNPNKHIHIPEYILMSWLLFEAFSIDYSGKGILILVFMCSTMLGVVDELQQGIHAYRRYGLGDMMINSASTLIGVITLMGVKKRPAGGWGWIDSLKKLKGSLGLVLFGTIGAIFLCLFLVKVKEYGALWGVYPLWLLAWNGLFLAFTPAAIFSRWRHLRKSSKSRQNQEHSDQHARDITAHLWVFSHLAVLLFIHMLVVFTAISGWQFD
jgi:hypothetical protein